MTRHFTDVDDLTAGELETVLARARALKAATGTNGAGATDDPLAQRTLTMLFEKPSTRTRVSFETGMTQLGGHAIFLGPNDTQLGRGEPIKDTARALSGYADAIMARVFEHREIAELAEYATVPVVNGLTDDAHPCQTLADLLTIHERCGGFEDVSVAWVGDGNNVAQSFTLGCALSGIDLRIATPPEHAVDESVIERAGDIGRAPDVVDDPATAVAGADVVYTDVWVSMGEEDEREAKLAAFEGYQVNDDLLGDGHAAVMHCLPAHRGEEITDEVLESDRSLVWQQAENRLHAQKGLLVELVG
jgi:ornithine carbamoyltransferase